MKIPPEILSIFEKETDGLMFGEVRFVCSMRDGKPRFVITKESSLYPETTGKNHDEPSQRDRL
jgi:hypothetical protein